MKCIYCGNDSTYPVRRGNGGKCGSCKHPFAFEPKLDPLHVSDGKFQKIIKVVSGDGKLYFTEKQLWYEFNRQAASRLPISCGASMIFWALLLPASRLIAGKHLFLAAVAAGLFSLAVLAVSKAPKQPPKPKYAGVSLAKFQAEYLAKWVHAHGSIDHLLSPPARLAAPTSTFNSGGGASEDLSAFSFDRVLVTEHADIAAMLVANNFHFENNCAILSLDGYPFDRFSAIFQMLGQNPMLKVFALHDASMSGCVMGASLRDPRWFPDPSLRIIDLGLRPLHAQKSGIILLKVDPTTIKPPTRSSMNADEMAWLAQGNIAELSALRPAKLMRAIYQGFARANQITDTDDFDEAGGMIWIYDGGVDVYATDSFG